MNKSSLGSRWVCFECQTPFFDLHKEKISCPKCGQDQADNPSRIILPKLKPKVAAKPRVILDEDIDFEHESGEVGIGSFEQLEESVSGGEEDEYV